MSSHDLFRVAPLLLAACLLPRSAMSDTAKAAVEGGGAPTPQATCFFVASYHAGHRWTDDIEGALRAGLVDRCRVITSYLDTKRERAVERMAAAGEAAHRRMLELAPDVVITSDDNAVRHFVEPWLIGTDMPVVFSGVNWTIEGYRLPASNVTGIIEVTPVRSLLELGRDLSGGTRIAFVGSDTHTNLKNLAHAQRYADELGLQVESLLVDNVAAFREAYVEAQTFDFVVLGERFGIAGWNEAEIEDFTASATRTLVLSAIAHMRPHAAVSLTQIAAEQGEWAAAAARDILDGVGPAAIPLSVNRRWDAWVNESLLTASGVRIDERFLHTAKRVR